MTVLDLTSMMRVLSSWSVLSLDAPKSAAALLQLQAILDHPTTQPFAHTPKKGLAATCHVFFLLPLVVSLATILLQSVKSNPSRASRYCAEADRLEKESSKAPQASALTDGWV